MSVEHILILLILFSLCLSLYIRTEEESSTFVFLDEIPALIVNELLVNEL